MSTSVAVVNSAGHAQRRKPLIAHVVFRFDYGGLENGVVNIVNNLPAAEFDHAIIALTEATEFRTRVRRPDVGIYPLHKRPGKDFGAYVRLWKLLRELRPTVVHTRNIGTMDCLLVAWLAGVPVRVHGEHGWDVHDPDGTSRKYLAIRRWLNPFTHRFITVSRELEAWLTRRVGVRPDKVTQICNGVDTQRFKPNAGARAALPPDRFPPNAIVFGTVTRLTEIKDPLNVVRAFLSVHHSLRAAGHDVRLAIVGDGPLRSAIETELDRAQAHAYVWMTGSRDDVAALLGAMDVFVLGSKREGISNTVLEAMASGLPVIASATGGNLELVEDGTTGALVPPEDSDALARTMASYARDAVKRRAHGVAARARAEQLYSLDGMMKKYRELYAMHCRRATETA